MFLILFHLCTPHAVSTMTVVCLSNIACLILFCLSKPSSCETWRNDHSRNVVFLMGAAWPELSSSCYANTVSLMSTSHKRQHSPWQFCILRSRFANFFILWNLASAHTETSALRCWWETT